MEGAPFRWVCPAALAGKGAAQGGWGTPGWGEACDGLLIPAGKVGAEWGVCSENNLFHQKD